MQVLNKKERKKAFLAFLLFFGITVVVLFCAILFNIYFPFKENRLLKSEKQRLENELAVQDKFSFELEKVKLP